jgi:hypothetical protein
LNALPASAFDFSSPFGNEDVDNRVKSFIFLAFIFAFGGLFGSAWIFFGYYVAVKPTPPPSESLITWLGLSVFLQNLLIFFRYMKLWKPGTRD